MLIEIEHLHCGMINYASCCMHANFTREQENEFRNTFKHEK